MADFPYETVLITGGTGTFGRAFARWVQRAYPEVRLRIFSRDEQKQARLRTELGESQVSYLLGDVRDLERLRLACRGVDLVIHAAALKIVPAGEYNPLEFVATNIDGSGHVVRAALDCGVAHTILLSSDKAVQPINLYGFTKGVAERCFVHANSYAPGGPRYNVVRYGNVLGSRGSVLAAFRAQLERGEPLALTHPAMTRFWMTPAEAVALVVYVALEALRGEVWVPCLPAFRLAEFVTACYQVAGLEPPDPLPISGIRPGEKLHEWLLTADEAARCVAVAAEDASYYIIPPHAISWPPGPADRQRFGAALTEHPAVPPYCSDVWPLRLEGKALAERLEALWLEPEDPR